MRGFLFLPSFSPPPLFYLAIFFLPRTYEKFQIMVDSPPHTHTHTAGRGNLNPGNFVLVDRKGVVIPLLHPYRGGPAVRVDGGVRRKNWAVRVSA